MKIFNDHETHDMSFLVVNFISCDSFESQFSLFNLGTQETDKSEKIFKRRIQQRREIRQVLFRHRYDCQ